MASIPAFPAPRSLTSAGRGNSRPPSCWAWARSSSFGLGEQSLLDDRRELHENLVRVIRQVRPQRGVTWSPEWNWKRFRSCHPDHLATGAAALTAIYPDAGNPFALAYLREEEGLEPRTVPEVWLINSPDREVNRYVDITGTFDRKVAAVTPTLGGQGYPSRPENTP